VIILERMAADALARAHPERSFDVVQVMVTSRLVETGEAQPATGSQALLFHPVAFEDVAAR
jgi:hypothetical protein